MVGLRKDFKYENDNSLTCNGLLPKPTNDYPNISELFGDIIDKTYLENLETSSYPSNPITSIQKKLRTTREGKTSLKGDVLTEQKYSKHSEKIVKKFQHMIDNNGEIPKQMITRKFVQRVIPKKWGIKGPTITATSLPDDFVHYVQPRSLTVREWARLQLFPDWYQFSGPRTTGGRKRAGDFSNGDWKRETPRYTQIGNAVPVKLSEEIGKHLIKLVR